MTIASFVEGAALLFSIALNGVALWFVKDYQRMDAENEELHQHSLSQGEEIEELRIKLTPWNKGKTGYKHKQPRAKRVTVKGPYTTGQYADYPSISELAPKTGAL